MAVSSTPSGLRMGERTRLFLSYPANIIAVFILQVHIPVKLRSGLAMPFASPDATGSSNRNSDDWNRSCRVVGCRYTSRAGNNHIRIKRH
jgi:hypothetical protein